MGEWDVRYLGSRDRAVGTKTFSFERPADLDYQPGQFFFVLLDQPQGPYTRPIEHHFSFSSSPTEPTVELTTRMTGHEFKQRLDALVVGEGVHIAGPDGAFVLAPGTTKVCYICGGIGITPARSTLRWVLDTHADVDLTVLYGNRDEASIAFHEEFEALDAPNVRVIDVLSSPPPGWKGRSGTIDAALVREEVADFAERAFFVSGPGGMVDAVASMLTQEVGASADHVVSEHFPGYASGPA